MRRGRQTEFTCCGRHQTLRCHDEWLACKCCPFPCCRRCVCVGGRSLRSCVSEALSSEQEHTSANASLEQAAKSGAACSLYLRLTRGVSGNVSSASTSGTCNSAIRLTL